MKIAKLFNKLKRIPKRYLAIVAVGVAIAVPAAVIGYGPERPVFDWNNNPGTCDLQANRGDRCGSINPVFNSFINTPSYGDERNFTRIAPVVAGQGPAQAQFTETQLATPGQEYWVRTLVHNDANQNLNCNPAHRDAATNDCTQIDWDDPASVGIAKDVKVSLEIAAGQGTGVGVMTKVHSSNATPTLVWDSATLTNGNQIFEVSYVPGSALLINDRHPSGVGLPDNITSADGTAIGVDQMDGRVPGCFNYSAYVYVKVKATAPALTFTKEVRMKGEDSTKWRGSLDAKSGDHVQYLLSVENTGTAIDKDIVVKDKLPKNITLDKGTVRFIVDRHPAPGLPVPDDFLFDDKGVATGDFMPGSNGFLIFDATVHKDDTSECSPVNVATAVGTGIPPKTGKAIVNITDCKPPKKEQALRCDSLTNKLVKDRTYEFKVKATTVNGATIKSYTYNFHDTTANVLTDKNPYQHTFPQAGTFLVTVVVNGTVNGKDHSTPVSEVCSNTITIGVPPQPQPQPTTPTVLPNTGSGMGIAGLFGLTTAVGTVAHRFFLKRRYDS